MFFGSFEHTIDAKGRLFLPTSIRIQVNETLYAMKGYDGCLSVYVKDDFEKRFNLLHELPFTHMDVRDVVRVESSSVVPLPIDEQGRILIPKKILEKFGISKKVVIVGVLDHFEIWDKATWDQYLMDKEKEFEGKSEGLNINENR